MRRNLVGSLVAAAIATTFAGAQDGARPGRRARLSRREVDRDSVRPTAHLTESGGKLAIIWDKDLAMVPFKIVQGS